MNPWIVRVVLAAAANAITLLIAAALFDKIEINAVTFLIAVAIFTVAALVVKPIAERLAGRYVRAGARTTHGGSRRQAGEEVKGRGASGVAPAGATRGVTWVAGLVTTYLALLITDIFSDGLSIEGVGTWIMGTVVVWLGTLLYDVVDDKLIASVGGHLAGPQRAAG
jgi:putative membrane protein